MLLPQPAKPHRIELEDIRFDREPEAKHLEKLKAVLQRMTQDPSQRTLDPPVR